MELKSILRVGVTVALLTTSLSVLAEQVLCPAIRSVKQSADKLNTVTLLNGQYAVYTNESAFNESNFPWYVVTQVDAKDFNSAFTKGQTNVRNTAMARGKYAMETDEAYLCAYFDADGQIVATFALKNPPGGSFKFTSFNFNKLK